MHARKYTVINNIKLTGPPRHARMKFTGAITAVSNGPVAALASVSLITAVAALDFPLDTLAALAGSTGGAVGQLTHRHTKSTTLVPGTHASTTDTRSPTSALLAGRPPRAQPTYLSNPVPPFPAQNIAAYLLCSGTDDAQAPGR